MPSRCMSGAVCLPGDAIRAGGAQWLNCAKSWAYLPGAIANFADIRLRVIEPAIAAVNQIADFVASYRLEYGPRNKVVAVELWFRPKDARRPERCRGRTEPLPCRPEGPPAGHGRDGGGADRAAGCAGIAAAARPAGKSHSRLTTASGLPSVVLRMYIT